MTASSRTCPKCFSEIHAKASICPHCRSKQPSIAGTAIKAAMVFGAAAIAITAILAISPFNAPHVTQNAPSADDARFKRIVSCQVNIANGLDDPKSADFPNFLMDPQAFYASAGQDGETIENFQFRARNRFGGMQKMAGECVFKGDKLISASPS